MLNEINKSIIREHALLESPNECCGLIISDKRGKEEVFKCGNVSKTPELTFKIKTEDYVKASRAGKVIATYHSHSNGIDAFSEFDKFNSNNHKLIYYLYCISKNLFLKYDPNQEFNSYIGRTFRIGESDCFTLMRDFYNNELSIPIKDYHRAENWKQEDKYIFEDNYKSEGFSKVQGEYKKYDCHLFRFRGSAAEHIAVNLGNNLILHQPLNGFSRIEELTPKHKKFIHFTIRHKDIK